MKRHLKFNHKENLSTLNYGICHFLFNTVLQYTQSRIHREITILFICFSYLAGSGSLILDPDQSKSSGSMRIRIHKHCLDAYVFLFRYVASEAGALRGWRLHNTKCRSQPVGSRRPKAPSVSMGPGAMQLNRIPCLGNSKNCTVNEQDGTHMTDK